MDMKKIRTLITVLLVVLVGAFFTLTTDSFLGTANMTQLLRDAAYVGTISIGMCMVMVSGNIDLSAGGIVCLTGIVCARLAQMGLHIILVFLGTVVVGILLGYLNSVMINHLHLTPFVATLAAGFVYTGLGMVFAFRDENGRLVNQMLRHNGLSHLASRLPGTIIYYCVVAWIVLVLVFYFIQVRTRFGMHVYAMGSNENSAKMSGVQLYQKKAACYMICGAMCAVAAVFTVAYNQTATPSLGNAMEFQAIAACVVGGVVMSGGSGNVIGAAFGALFMSMLTNGLLKYGIGTDWQYMLQGGIIIIATAFDAIFTKVTNARMRAQNA